MQTNNNNNNNGEQKMCHFCANKIDEIDFRDTVFLKKFINQRGKITAPKRTGTCSKHQRRLANAIKRARAMALVSPSAK